MGGGVKLPLNSCIIIAMTPMLTANAILLPGWFSHLMLAINSVVLVFVLYFDVSKR